MGSVSVPGVGDGLRQVGVIFTESAFQSCKTDDLAFVVDGACGLQIQGGVCGHESIQVDCVPVAPERGPWAEAGVEGQAKDQVLIADGDRGAVRVARNG